MDLMARGPSRWKERERERVEKKGTHSAPQYDEDIMDLCLRNIIRYFLFLDVAINDSDGWLTHTERIRVGSFNYASLFSMLIKELLWGMCI